MPVQFGKVPLEVVKSKEYLRQQAWRFRHQGIDDVSPLGRASDKVTMNGRSTQLFFEHPQGKNILTQEHLKTIKSAEEDFASSPQYEVFCKVISRTGECAKPKSITNFFDGTYVHVDRIFNDPDFENIPEVLGAADELMPIEFVYHLGAGSEIKPESKVYKSNITRSVFSHSLNKAGEKEFEEFLDNHAGEKMKSMREKGLHGLDFLYFNFHLYVRTVQGLVSSDLALSGGSFCFIVLFMWFQTRSAFVTCMAVLGIISNFFATNMVYRIVLDYKYFGVFHVLAVFIILGIGADDVFVFYDTWKASALINFATLEERLSYCYGKAAKSTLITSLTTALAFAASAATPILGLHSFGLFSAILVTINYLSVITFFPAVILHYHRSWENCRCCFRVRTSKAPSDSATDLHRNDPDSDSEIRNPVIRVLTGGYFKLFGNRSFCVVIVALFTAQLAVSAFFASCLQPEDGPVSEQRS